MDERDTRDLEERLGEILRLDAAERAHIASQLSGWQRWANEFMSTKVQPAFQTIEALFAKEGQGHQVTLSFPPPEPMEASRASSNDKEYVRATLKVAQESGEYFSYQIALTVTPHGIDWRIYCTGSKDYRELGASDPDHIGATAISHISSRNIANSFLNEYERYLQQTR